MTTQYEIRLEGVHASDLPLGLLRDLADFVVEGSSRAARLAAEGRSTARDAAPAWLGDSSDVRLVGLQRIEIDRVDLATAHDVLWRRAPRGELAHERLDLPSEGLAKYFGAWPGNEDDDQLFAAMRVLG